VNKIENRTYLGRETLAEDTAILSEEATTRIWTTNCDEGRRTKHVVCV